MYRPWRLQAGKGSDEWDNKSVYIMLPLLGEFVFFYEKNVDRSKWYCLGMINDYANFVSPDHQYFAEVHKDKITKFCNCEEGCWVPMPLSYNEILSLANNIESTEE